MKTKVLPILSILVLASTTSFAEKGVSFADRMYNKLPSITTYEKHCLMNYQSGTELERCLESRPDTDLHKMAKQRSRKRLSTLNELSLEYSYENSSSSDPWFQFCLENVPYPCTIDCSMGFVCADNHDSSVRY